MSIKKKSDSKEKNLLSLFGSKTLTQEEIYNKVCELDDRKNILCKENNINLIYYAETDEKYRYSLCRNKNELLKTLNDFVNSK